MAAARLFCLLTNKPRPLQVLLAKLKADNKFYAIKVLQKKVILKKKEVGSEPTRAPSAPLTLHPRPDDVARIFPFVVYDTNSNS
jgi:hypothetical protein